MNQIGTKEYRNKSWIISNFLGWLLGAFLIIMFSSFLDSMGIEHLQFYLGLGMGLGVGLFQWFILRKLIPININWLIISSIGMGFPFVVLDQINQIAMNIKLPLGVIIGAILTSYAQSILLSKFSNNSKKWIINSSLAWVLAELSISLMDLTMKIRASGYINLIIFLLNLVLILAGGLILGYVTSKTIKGIIEDYKQTSA